MTASISKFPAQKVTGNFYISGITDSSEIIVFQYISGTWTDVKVTEFRVDHIVLNLEQNVVIAFIH